MWNTTWVLPLLLTFILSAEASTVGRFSAPNFSSIEALSDKEHSEFEARFSRLQEADFISESHVRGPSFYSTDAGLSELHSLAVQVLGATRSAGKIVFIGRSGDALLAYMNGLKPNPHLELDDLPLSMGKLEENGKLNVSQRQDLRAYLRRASLDPKTLAKLERPILFFDFVYTAHGAHLLLSEINRWAKELNLHKEVKKKLLFFGAYPAELIATYNITQLNLESSKEFGGVQYEVKKTEIDQVTASMTLPRQKALLGFCQEVHSMQISSSMYTYSGTHSPHTHDSLVPEHWASASTLIQQRTQPYGFVGQSGVDAFLELYYLYMKGKIRASQVGTTKLCLETIRPKKRNDKEPNNLPRSDDSISE